MNSDDLKTELLAWLRYLRRCELVCTEVGRYSADVWGLDGRRLIEIETKISISDLRADFRKQKHGLYDRYAAEGARWQVPNAFYFAMPADLIDKAKEFLATVELPVVKKYGLITVPDLRQILGRNAAVVVKAGKIHGAEPTAATREVALMRMASELCGTRQALATHRRLLESGLQNLTATMRDLYTHQVQQQTPELEEENVGSPE